MRGAGCFSISAPSQNTQREPCSSYMTVRNFGLSRLLNRVRANSALLFDVSNSARYCCSAVANVRGFWPSGETFCGECGFDSRRILLFPVHQCLRPNECWIGTAPQFNKLVIHS